MTESRQQRRARHRADAKEHQQPGPASVASTRVLDVELHRIVNPDGDDPNVVFWAAQWGLRDNSSGVEDSVEDLDALIAEVLDDARSHARQHAIEIVWNLDGDAPPGQTVSDAITALGVSLPTRP